MRFSSVNVSRLYASVSTREGEEGGPLYIRYTLSLEDLVGSLDEIIISFSFSFSFFFLFFFFFAYGARISSVISLQTFLFIGRIAIVII